MVVFGAMDKLKIRTIFEYEFLRGNTAAQTTRNINDVYGPNTACINTVHYWFNRFKTGNFELKNEPRGRPVTIVDNDELKAIVEADPTQSTAELAAGFGVSVKTTLKHLRQIGKIKKLDKWVPHELNDQQRDLRVEACIALLNRHRNEGILNRIVTCDEKWILYDNRKRSSQWVDPGTAPNQCAKEKITHRKMMVTVWWTSAGLVHHSFLPNGTTMTADVYCQELQTMMEKLAIQQPTLVNRSSLLLLHDNARVHTSRQTIAKLQELQLEALRHPPYSPDLAPTDFYFFQNLDNFLSGKKFNTREAVQNAFADFIASRPADFYSKGINKLPSKWQNCIDNLGQYFD